MNEPASQSFPATPLRVAIVAGDAERRATLTELVEAAGHEVVGAADAQVILCDGANATEIDAALSIVEKAVAERTSAFETVEFESLPESAAELLTPRELDVLVAISDGLSNKAVAQKLGISLHTVKFHVESLLRKLGARTRAEAVARGLERRKAERVDV
jgi:DNA-binding NarL/FixJ family response regulator